MTILELALLIVCGLLFSLIIILFIALIAVSIFAIRYGKIALAWEENINESLDRLNESYQTFAIVLQKPLFRDTPEVRHLLLEIAKCQETILWIAQAMTLPVKPMQLNVDNEIRTNEL